MPDSDPGSDTPPKKRRSRSRWPERLWLLAGVVFLAGAGILTLLQNWRDQAATRGITREILPELEPADRIEAAPASLKDWNVVFITTDTTRADHLGCYGNKSVETPVLDRLAREGILCADNVTPSPSTLPAHSSLLTGLYPVNHGARANGTFKLKKGVTTLAERLKEKGYRTGAVISAFVLDSRFGIDQGFDYFNDDLTKGMKYSPNMFRERAAELTNEPATQWLRENAGNAEGDPFFLWVHYFDPHAVYLPPEPFRTRYKHDLYDGEIAYVDSQIGVLLDELEELGVRDKTLVVYTSDHGEGLGEHGEQTHSLLIYDSTLHVPMIFNAPGGLPAGVVIERQTCLVDVAPTVLSLLGEEVPEGEMDGADLTRGTEANRPVLIETIATMTLHGWAPLLGVRRDDYKYIFAPTPELYDLREDDRELVNLHDEAEPTVSEMSAQMANWLGQDPFLATKNAVDLSNLVVDPETVRRLSALGYVASETGEVDDEQLRRDPKEMIVHWETLQQAMNIRGQGRPDEALPILEQATAEVPGDLFARNVLANIYRQMGEDEKALEQHAYVAEQDPATITAWLGMAGIYLGRRDFEKAQEMIDKALRIEPASADAYMSMAAMALAKRQPDEARELYEKVILMDPGTSGPSAHNQIGTLHLHAGEYDKARERFRSALRIDALNGSAHDGLARILQAEGKTEEAMAELQTALRFDPNQVGALATLASLISQKGDQEKALEIAKRALKISPNYASAHSNIGLIYRRSGDLEKAEEHYKKAIEFEPHLDAPYVNLAQLYTRQGKSEEALEQFRAAVKANPAFPNPIALGNLGSWHFNKGEYQEALVLYRRALRRDPDYALVHKHIASVYTTGQFDDPALAAFHLKRSLELDPGQAEAPQMRELMAKAEAETARRLSAKLEDGGGKADSPPAEELKVEPIVPGAEREEAAEGESR